MSRVLICFFLFFGFGAITSYNFYIGNATFIFWMIPTILFYTLLIFELFKLKNK